MRMRGMYPFLHMHVFLLSDFRYGHFSAYQTAFCVFFLHYTRPEPGIQASLPATKTPLFPNVPPCERAETGDATMLLPLNLFSFS